MTKAKILIVDDHPIVRQGLAQLINRQADLSVYGEAGDAAAARKAVDNLCPDLVLLDLSLRDIPGIDLIKEFQIRQPKLPILVLSMLDQDLYAERVLRAGARGYVMKQEATEKVLIAIRRVLQGEVYVDEKMVSKILKKVAGATSAGEGSPQGLLSDRELQIFQLIGRGHGTGRIAEELHLSVKTIETHRAHMKEKLKLKDSEELTQYAVSWMAHESRA
jgi:DNA-binding NarL/FixJ family response regulator